MTPKTTPWVAALFSATICALFAWFVRLPLPFTGFAAGAAAALAALGTLTLVAWMPRTWIWSEAEMLRHAFMARHGLSDTAAGSALEAITMAHGRAIKLRQTAEAMREEVANKVRQVADRLDIAAREIFYAPERQRQLRSVLVRSELIEDAATAHAALRLRKHEATEQTSRAKLVAALDALDAAFDETDLLAAQGLLHNVAVASDVAEKVLAPRHAPSNAKLSDPSL